jgi:uncharacterized protein (DUF488 family)
VTVFTIGHGVRSGEDLIATLNQAAVRTVVDVRRFPGSRRNPQFNQRPLAEALGAAGIDYSHEVELGGRLSGEPGEERFPCIRVPAFRSYAVRMGTEPWQEALVRALRTAAPQCFMCAETVPWRCHRRLISDALVARGWTVCHIGSSGRVERHSLTPFAHVDGDRLTYPPEQTSLGL